MESKLIFSCVSTSTSSFNVLCMLRCFFPYPSWQLEPIRLFSSDLPQQKALSTYTNKNICQSKNFLGGGFTPFKNSLSCIAIWSALAFKYALEIKLNIFCTNSREYCVCKSRSSFWNTQTSPSGTSNHGTVKLTEITIFFPF